MASKESNDRPACTAAAHTQAFDNNFAVQHKHSFEQQSFTSDTMARKLKKDDELALSKGEHDQRKSMFQRLFAPDSVETDVSAEDDDDYSHRTDGHSLDSATYYGSDDSGSDDETDEPSATSTLLKFDRDLRARHRGACKNMTNGKYARAIKTFESILSDLLERFGEEHHRVGAALHNVAVANLRAGLLDDAKDAIEEAVRIRKLTLGDEHPKVAVSSAVVRQTE